MTAVDDMQAAAVRAEAAVLGACLLGADIATVAPYIGDDEHTWGREAHRVLWDAIVAVHNDGIAVDTVAVVDRLQRSGQLAVVGGPVALTDLAAAAPGRSQADHWAQMAAESAQRRRAWHAARQVMADVTDPTVDPWSILDRVTNVAQAPTGGLDVVSGPAILDLPPTSWLIDDWFPTGVSMLFGRRSTYKSFVALSVALSVATGRPWWGHHPSVTGPVVYIAAEGRGGLAPRLDAAIDSPADLARMHTVDGAGLRFTSPRDVARVDQVLARHRPVLAVIDTWARLSGVRDENDNAEASAVISTLDRLHARHGTSWLIVHHSSSDDSKARGATSIEDNVEVSYVSRRDDDAGWVVLANNKPPKDAPVPPAKRFKLRPHRKSAVLELVSDGRGVTDVGRRTGELLDVLRRDGHIGAAAAASRFGQQAVDRLRNHAEVQFADDPSTGAPVLRVRRSPF